MSWHGVVAASSPGVTAQDALDGEPCALDGSVLGDGFDGIVAARGCVAARGRQQR